MIEVCLYQIFPEQALNGSRVECEGCLIDRYNKECPRYKPFQVRDLSTQFCGECVDTMIKRLEGRRSGR